jgi:hypothetical protein
MAGAGDVDAGKAWKTVRRPSDMVFFFFCCGKLADTNDDISQNEYSKQIKEYRAQQNPGKAYGKVFVKGEYFFFIHWHCAYARVQSSASRACICPSRLNQPRSRVL